MPAIPVTEEINIFYTDTNITGMPAVLLLHGLGATGESWAFQIPALVDQGFRVLIPDLRGFGRSTYGGRPHTIEDMVCDVIALLDAVELPSVHVVGISMGGAIALQLASEYPERVQRLVLVNTFAYLRPHSWKELFFFASRLALIYSLGLPAQARFVTKRLFPLPDQEFLRQALMEQILQSDPRGYRAAMRALMRFNLKERLYVLKNKTLVITGECDLTVSTSSQRYLAENIPDACQVIIPNAGHAVTGEKPEEFNHALIQFLIE